MKKCTLAILTAGVFLLLGGCHSSSHHKSKHSSHTVTEVRTSPKPVTRAPGPLPRRGKYRDAKYHEEKPVVATPATPATPVKVEKTPVKVVKTPAKVVKTPVKVVKTPVKVVKTPAKVVKVEPEPKTHKGSIKKIETPKKKSKKK
ncbi:MAG: hypothetical protein K6F50_05305 [Kiritimatiellae bacterium]|nr:hypothetical protein [Kiritimatiellia bacterium]